jgi:PAS domain S-box-containing protein
MNVSRKYAGNFTGENVYLGKQPGVPVDRKERVIAFVGGASGELDACGRDVRYFEDSASFFQSLREGTLVPSDITVFYRYSTRGLLDEFIDSMIQYFPQLQLLTPLVLIFQDETAVPDDPHLEEFDYVSFSPLDAAHAGQLADLLSAKKKSELERTSLNLINRAILSDLLAKQNTEARRSLPDAATFYFGVDSRGVFQAIGDEVLSILGFSRDEIIGHHFLELVSRDEFEQLKRAFTERRTGSRRTRDLVVKFRTKEGGQQEFLIDTQGIHLPSVQEHPEKEPFRMYVGTFGKVAPPGLPKKTIDVFESSREPILIYNETEGRLVANQGFQEFTGYGREEIIHRSPAFFEKPERSCFSRCAGSLPVKGHLVYNTVLVTKSGHERYCEVSLDHVLWNGTSSYIAIYSDLTNFMKLIDEAETLIQLTWEIGNLPSVNQLVEAAADRVYSILKIPFLSIVLCGDEEDDVGSYCVKTASGLQWIESENAAFHGYLRPLLAEAREEQKTVYRTTEETAGFREAGDSTAGAGKGVAVVSPLIASGDVIGFIVVLQEENGIFTLHGIRLLELSTNVIAAGIHKLRLEMQLRKNLETMEVRVQERTKELEDFIYTISHDLKSPLHAAQGFADMVKKQFASSIQSSDDEYILRRIRENVDQAIMMINDLLELSRIGTRELKFEEVDLNAVIREYAMQFNALNQKDIDLKISIGSRIPPVHADAGRIVQLLTNLFNNSIKYRQSGQVHIVIERELKNGRLKLLIGDNGKGIDEKELSHVFKIFYRGRDAIENRIEGSGLGLTIVKKIVQQHGGSIDIRSRPGAGTTIILELPLKQDQSDRDVSSHDA